MTAISILESHILETKAQIKILQHKDIRSCILVSQINENIAVRQQKIKELEDAIAILAKVSN
jgi:hypothetical protein